jgi:hypothetical protein
MLSQYSNNMISRKMKERKREKRKKRKERKKKERKKKKEAKLSYFLTLLGSPHCPCLLGLLATSQATPSLN